MFILGSSLFKFFTLLISFIHFSNLYSEDAAKRLLRTRKDLAQRAREAATAFLERFKGSHSLLAYFPANIFLIFYNIPIFIFCFFALSKNSDGPFLKLFIENFRDRDLSRNLSDRDLSRNYSDRDLFGIEICI